MHTWTAAELKSCWIVWTERVMVDQRVTGWASEAVRKMSSLWFILSGSWESALNFNKFRSVTVLVWLTDWQLNTDDLISSHPTHPALKQVKQFTCGPRWPTPDISTALTQLQLTQLCHVLDETKRKLKQLLLTNRNTAAAPPPPPPPPPATKAQRSWRFRWNKTRRSLRRRSFCPTCSLKWYETLKRNSPTLSGSLQMDVFSLA